MGRFQGKSTPTPESLGLTRGRPRLDEHVLYFLQARRLIKKKKKKRRSGDLSSISSVSVTDIDLSSAIQGEAAFILRISTSLKVKENVSDRNWRQADRGGGAGKLPPHGSGADWTPVIGEAAGPVFVHCDQDQEALSHANRRGALGAAPLHGKQTTHDFDSFTVGLTMAIASGLFCS